MYILRGRTRVRPRFFNRQNAITHLKEVGDGILSGRSVIIGSQKTQIYQRFAGSRQEVFILKIQNDENNAAQQDNGRRFHI